MCRMICELNMMSISAWKSIFCSELRGGMQMDQFFGKVDEFFSLKRWAADGFQIVDSVQKKLFQGEPTVERNANHIPIQEKRKVLVHI